MSQMNKQFLLNIYYNMSLTRRFEEVLCAHYQQGKLPEKPMTSIGQEASAVGATACLEKDDYVLPSLRTRGSFFAKGMPAKQLLTELHRRANSISGGRWTAHHLGNMDLGIILSSAVIASTIPVAVGAALSAKNRGTKQVALAFFGDGGSSTGAIHESMNFAAVMDLPIIFLCENNKYSLSTPLQLQTKNENIADRAAGYGIEGNIVDGQDVIEVIYAVQRAIHRARHGGGPTLIECKTYKFRGHSESHPPDDGRPKEELELWRKRCPLAIFKRYLIENGVDAAELTGIEEKVAQEMKQAVAYVETCPPPPIEEVEKFVYA